MIARCIVVTMGLTLMSSFALADDFSGHYEGYVNGSPILRDVRIQPQSEGNAVIWLQKTGSSGPGTYIIDGAKLVLHFKHSRFVLKKENNQLVGVDYLEDGRQARVNFQLVSPVWNQGLAERGCDVNKYSFNFLADQGSVFQYEGTRHLSEGETIKRGETSARCHLGVFWDDKP